MKFHEWSIWKLGCVYQESVLAEHLGGDDVHDCHVGFEHNARHEGATHVANLLNQSAGSHSEVIIT